MSDSADPEDLKRRARELREKAAASDDSSNAPVFLQRLRGRAWYMKGAAALLTIQSWLGPFGRLLGWLFRLLARWLRWVFLKKHDDGRVTLSFAQTLLRGAISFAAIILTHVALSAIYYYATAFEETVYVTGKQEIETGELYQFGGCTSLPCATDSDNGKFYLIESSLYFPVLFYPEEDVFANIPQQNGACRVRGYGIYFRTLRWLYKSAQLYQHVVRVSCRPYTEEEIERAVEGGQIVEGAFEDAEKERAPVEGP